VTASRTAIRLGTGWRTSVSVDFEVPEGGETIPFTGIAVVTRPIGPALRARPYERIGRSRSARRRT